MIAQGHQTISIPVGATALTIAGSDPSGGAGLQADLKVFQQLEVYGMSAVTLITVQNTVSVEQIEVLLPELVDRQLAAVLDDIPPVVIKTGALGSAENIEVIANRLRDVNVPIVVDPVLMSKHGDRLADDSVLDAYRQHLLPLATVVTPNRHEAELFFGGSSDEEQALQTGLQQFHGMGAEFVLIKLGRRDDEMIHVVSEQGNDHYQSYACPNLDRENLHGAGCVLSAAIAAAIARGAPVSEAIPFAIGRTHEAISVGCEYGNGISPVDVRAIRKIEE